MKSLLISIQPKRCEKIAKREETIEVRKTRPKIETPFKAYIYCAKGNDGYEWLYRVDNNGYGKAQSWHGKVIGEFICDKVYLIKNQGSMFSVADEEQSVTNEIARQSCLDYYDMVGYLGNKDGYGLHITALKIYDKPKELSEFINPCSRVKCISGCKDMKIEHAECLNKNKRPITRPPQSYMFVEDLGETK